ncbi:MAG: radical SAM protein [Acidobacteriota bacterium]
MRYVLADLRGTRGLVAKDTVVGGYGSRMVPFSITTRLYSHFKKLFHDIPSIQLAYLAAILAEKGHEVLFTRDGVPEGDVAIVLSSIVDSRNECAWADAARRKGLRVGFVGLAASFLPELFREHADFLVRGEPERAIRSAACGAELSGICESASIDDLDSLPFPRWDIAGNGHAQRFHFPFHHKPIGGGVPVLASRSCPEHCVYCPHRVLAGYRARTVSNVVDELSHLFRFYQRPFVAFRDPQFTARREWAAEICERILSGGLRIRFECETRLDRLDVELLRLMHRAGLRMLTFGGESASDAVLKKAGRRPIDVSHQRHLLSECYRMGIATAGQFLLGFPEDDWDSIGATIKYAMDIAPTFAQFKILTPYPGTPLWKRCEHLITETDWEKFDGYHPTYGLEKLSANELTYLLGAAYARFYLRPSYMPRYLHLPRRWISRWCTELDERVRAYRNSNETAAMGRPVIP